MFDFAGAARAIWFMSALTGLGIVAPIWITFASHCFLNVLTESSIGDWEVRWPDESILDWWWKPLYCLALLAFWVTASGVVLGFVILLSPWAFAAAIALFLCVGYPVSLLCVMDARSSVAVVHLPLIVRLAANLPLVLLVGLITLVPVLIVGGLLAGLLLHSVLWAVPAAIVLPPALCFYARCWGRLAWMILNLKPRAAKPEKETPPPESEHTASHDPWALPREEPVPEIEVKLDEPEPPPAAPDADDEWAEQPVPYTMTSGKPLTVAEDAAATGQFAHAEFYDGYRKREELRRARAEGRRPGERKRRRRATFRNAFGADLLPFMVHWRTIRAMLSLAVATFFFLVLVRIAFLTAPPIGG
jgi:hypothetical protein